MQGKSVSPLRDTRSRVGGNHHPGDLPLQNVSLYDLIHQNLSLNPQEAENDKNTQENTHQHLGELKEQQSMLNFIQDAIQKNALKSDQYTAQNEVIGRNNNGLPTESESRNLTEPNGEFKNTRHLGSDEKDKKIKYLNGVRQRHSMPGGSVTPPVEMKKKELIQVQNDTVSQQNLNEQLREKIAQFTENSPNFDLKTDDLTPKKKILPKKQTSNNRPSSTKKKSAQRQSESKTPSTLKKSNHKTYNIGQILPVNPSNNKMTPLRNNTLSSKIGVTLNSKIQVSRDKSASKASKSPYRPSLALKISTEFQQVLKSNSRVSSPTSSHLKTTYNRPSSRAHLMKSPLQQQNTSKALSSYSPYQPPLSSYTQPIQQPSIMPSASKNLMSTYEQPAVGVNLGGGYGGSESGYSMKSSQLTEVIQQRAKNIINVKGLSGTRQKEKSSIKPEQTLPSNAKSQEKYQQNLRNQQLVSKYTKQPTKKSQMMQALSKLQISSLEEISRIKKPQKQALVICKLFCLTICAFRDPPLEENFKFQVISQEFENWQGIQYFVLTNPNKILAECHSIKSRITYKSLVNVQFVKELLQIIAVSETLLKNVPNTNLKTLLDVVQRSLIYAEYKHINNKKTPLKKKETITANNNDLVDVNQQETTSQQLESQEDFHQYQNNFTEEDVSIQNYPQESTFQNKDQLHVQSTIDLINDSYHFNENLLHFKGLQESLRDDCQSEAGPPKLRNYRQDELINYESKEKIEIENGRRSHAPQSNTVSPQQPKSRDNSATRHKPNKSNDIAPSAFVTQNQDFLKYLDPTSDTHSRVSQSTKKSFIEEKANQIVAEIIGAKLNPYNQQPNVIQNMSYPPSEFITQQPAGVVTHQTTATFHETNTSSQTNDYINQTFNLPLQLNNNMSVPHSHKSSSGVLVIHSQKQSSRAGSARGKEDYMDEISRPSMINRKIQQEDISIATPEREKEKKKVAFEHQNKLESVQYYQVSQNKKPPQQQQYNRSPVKNNSSKSPKKDTLSPTQKLIQFKNKSHKKQIMTQQIQKIASQFPGEEMQFQRDKNFIYINEQIQIERPAYQQISNYSSVNDNPLPRQLISSPIKNNQQSSQINLKNQTFTYCSNTDIQKDNNPYYESNYLTGGGPNTQPDYQIEMCGMNKDIFSYHEDIVSKASSEEPIEARSPPSPMPMQQPLVIMMQTNAEVISEEVKEVYGIKEQSPKGKIVQEKSPSSKSQYSHNPFELKLNQVKQEDQSERESLSGSHISQMSSRGVDMRMIEELKARRLQQRQQMTTQFQAQNYQQSNENQSTQQLVSENSFDMTSKRDEVIKKIQQEYLKNLSQM